MPACSRACRPILPWLQEWLLDRGVDTDRKPLAGDTPGGRFSFAPAFGRSSTWESAGFQNQWLRVRFLPSKRSTTPRGERACVLTIPQRNTKRVRQAHPRAHPHPRGLSWLPVVPGRAAPGLLAPTGRATPLQGEGFPVRIRGGPLGERRQGRRRISGRPPSGGHLDQISPANGM